MLSKAKSISHANSIKTTERIVHWRFVYVKIDSQSCSWCEYYEEAAHCADARARWSNLTNMRIYMHVNQWRNQSHLNSLIKSFQAAYFICDRPPKMNLMNLPSVKIDKMCQSTLIKFTRDTGNWIKCTHATRLSSGNEVRYVFNGK